ncbi:MAG: hypothetical protein RLZZ237_1171 [Pseudomonadota bacterium]|jgi:uncharacterized membrane protein YbaN (DUF454 family)
MMEGQTEKQHSSAPLPETHGARLRRWAWTAAGALMVLLGIIGAMLPVMPTTIFLILALACFSRASPRLEHWLLHHPRFGPSLRQWREHRAVSRRGKAMACLGMAIGFVAMCLGRPPAWVIMLVGVMEMAVIIYLLRRPNGPPPSHTGSIKAESSQDSGNNEK